ncbi:serine hydrolase domain-containing protein [Robertkochia aurantiaca]|uniref:serine hydrolase domain-containing protein n=1 Tax=Robertkochia aurantiaca TaxID=2873700 RepID=UPI001CCE4EA6|nr:serine hydrolase [Robertkochia sp. 3YJGBD-33]
MNQKPSSQGTPDIKLPFLIKRLFFLFILIFMNSAGCSLAQDLPADMLAEINRRTEKDINPAIAMAILHPDDRVTYHNFGETNNLAPDSLTLFEIGSLTKTFTAYQVLQYFNEESDQELETFLLTEGKTELPWKRIAIGDLLNHKAGIPRLSPLFQPENWADPFKGYTEDKFYEELIALDPENEAAWSYSNLGYAILGKTLEVKSGKNYEELMGPFLKGIGMEHTCLSHESVAAEIAIPTHLGIANSYWHFDGPSHYAGGLISNTRDLTCYLRFLKEHHTLFTGDTGDVIPTGIDDLGKNTLFYKKGWFVWKPDTNTEILIHNGGTGGFSSFIGYNKSSETGIVVLSNSLSLSDDLGLHLLYPGFKLRHPERTIAYTLAQSIEQDQGHDLVKQYHELKQSGEADDIVDIYWLERFHFGKGHYQISNQLCDIMIEALPDDWEVYDLKAQNLEKLQQLALAASYYQEAIERNPDDKGLLARFQNLQNQMKN